jgi:glycosyltransferase involved in cell wall biosynthesis
VAARAVKVLHVHRIGGIGGSERHLLTLLPALAERGLDVRFLGLDDPARAPDPFYEQLNVPYQRTSAPRDVDATLALRTARAVRRARPDIVHTHLVHADLYGALHRRLLVSTKHNDDPFRAGPFRFVEQALARRAARIVTITDALRRFQIDRVGLSESKLVTIHYGLDEPPPAWGANPPDDVAADARVLLAICRLEYQKGLDVAVRALATVRARHSGVELVVLGEGPERPALEALARECGVKVHLLGRVPNVAAWLRRATLLVHPVRWEGFGLAVLEAMVAGVPVVASRVSSLPELVADGETGVLVAPDDPDVLAEAIDRVLASPEPFRAAGARRARERFSVARMADATLALYESITAGRDTSLTHHPPPTQTKGGARA